MRCVCVRAKKQRKSVRESPEMRRGAKREERCVTDERRRPACPLYSAAAAQTERRDRAYVRLEMREEKREKA